MYQTKTRIKLKKKKSQSDSKQYVVCGRDNVTPKGQIRNYRSLVTKSCLVEVSGSGRSWSRAASSCPNNRGNNIAIKALNSSA